MTTKRPRRPRIMVVDDDVVVLEITRERLESAGYEVSIRDKALGTSAAIFREKPDFVLLDVNMPGLGGDAIARLIARGDAADRPQIILHSSSNRERLMALANECGAIGVIQKTSDARKFLVDLTVCMSGAA